MAKDKSQPEEKAPEPEVKTPAPVAVKPSPKKDPIIWVKLKKKAYMRKDPGSKPVLLQKGEEIQIFKSQFSKQRPPSMVDITAEKKVSELAAEKRRKAIKKAEEELANED